MAEIPQAIDYGARPSLRSNRLDVPGSGELQVADALGTAADTLVRVIAERKGKEDHLAYATAKSRLLQADIQTRRELEEDGKWESYAEDYRNKMSVHRDRITPSISNPNDAAIFAADSDLTVERGFSAMAEATRVRRIDAEVADLDESLNRLPDDMLNADPSTRNDMLMTGGELIQSNVEKGNISAQDGIDRQKALVRSVAAAELITMDVKDAIEALEKSIAANLPQDEIGAGTGSLADFLPDVEKQKLLNTFKAQHDRENTLGAAFESSNQAWELYPDYKDARERQDYLRKDLKDNPEALKEALLEDRLRRSTESAIDGQQRLDVYESMRDLLRGGEDEGMSFNQLPSSQIARLSNGEEQALRKEAQNFRERNGWNDVNEWDALEIWRALPATEKVKIDLKTDYMPKLRGDDDNLPWSTQITMEQARQWQTQQQQYQDAGAKEPITERGLNPGELLEHYLVESEFFAHKPTKTDSKELKGRWARIETEWNKVVISASEEKGARLRGSELNQLMARFMENTVYTRTVGFDKERLAQGLSEEDRKSAYISLTDPRANQIIKPVGEITFMTPEGRKTVVLPPGKKLPLREWLSNMAKSYGAEPDNKDLEEAIYYYYTYGVEYALGRVTGTPGF